MLSLNRIRNFYSNKIKNCFILSITFTRILNFFDDRIKKFGAPYHAFAIFGLINYPLAYFIRVYIQKIPDSESIFWRIVPTLLCLGLFLRDYWPNKIKKFLPLYWFLTVTMSIPVVIGYLMVKNNFSLEWLINTAVGLLITILVLDWLMFLISMAIGTIAGYLIFTLQYGFVKFNADSSNLHLAIYLYVMIILFCLIFSRHKDRFNISVSDLLRRKISKKTEELENSLIIKEQFLNSVSHEIRGPIHVLDSIANDLLKEWRTYSPRKISRAIKQISENTHRLIDLVNNWINVAAVPKHIALEMKQNNLLNIIKGMLPNMNILAEKKKVHVSFTKRYERNVQDYNIVCNKERIEQVFANICMNAIKFSPSKSEIIVDIYKHAEKFTKNRTVLGLCVSIKDRGVGILQKDLDLVFNSFFQSNKIQNKPSGSNKFSLGLGLALAKEIITRHHGKIWVNNNQDGPGCIFYFFIPFQQPAKNVSVKKRNKKIGKDKGLRILFLDDDPSCCIAGKLVITSLGHKIKTFTHVKKFFEYLKIHYSKIDIIFLDMIMPISGIDVIKEIKFNEHYKNIPIIAQSGIVNDPELNELFAFKNVGFISKPFNRFLVNTEIERMMNIVKAEKTNYTD